MIFDCEGNGLFPTKFHVLSYMEDGKVKSLTSHKQMKEWLLSQDVLIGHNIRLWDVPHLERVLNIKITATIHDTLFLSWYIFPNRTKYGLEWFGEDYGIKKPNINDWENLSLEEYVYRCEEDVRINAKLWDHITRDIGYLYGVPQEDVINLPIIKYLGFKALCAYKQEKVKWKLDIDFCKAAIAKLEPIKKEKSDALAAVMPNVVKMKKKDPPTKPYKKDGTLSVEGAKWQKYLSEQGLKKNHSLPISIVDKIEPPKPTSPIQIKDWLFSLGWEPCTFKYVKEDDGSTRTIPQIKKLDEPELTDSVIALIDEHPEVAHLEGLSMVSHRLATLYGFLENVDEDGFISAQIQGLTNTLRFKHKVLVNLPGVDKPYGDLIRGCLVAREGKTLIGSDQTSLENTTQRHYMYDYDPEYVEEMNKPGYDSHLDLAAAAGVLTKEQIWEPDAASKYKSIRKAYKKTNYCLPMDTQVLTKSGWKYYQDISVGDSLPCYDADSGLIFDGIVENKHFYSDTPVTKYYNKRSSFVCTPNHKWFSMKRSGAARYFKCGFTEAQNLKTEDNLVLSAPYYNDNPSSVTVNEALLMGFILSDGYWRWSEESDSPSTSFGSKRGVILSITQSKNKFWKSLEHCLVNLRLDYRKDVSTRDNQNHVYSYYIKASCARDYLDKVVGTRLDKHEVNWTAWVMNLSRKSLESFYHGFYMGDGCAERSLIDQNEGEIFDALVAATQLLGMGRVLISGKGKCRSIRRGRTNNLTWQKVSSKDVGTVDTFCLTTSGESFIIRQGDFVGITGNSAIYGIQAPKLSRELKVPQREAQSLLDAYWTRNWSIKKLSEDLTVKKVNGQMWLFNPVSKFWYSLRYDKDRFSTLNQGTGVYCFDMWVREVYKEYDTILGQFHDEIILEVDRGDNWAEEYLNSCIHAVNNKLKLNVPLGISTKRGNSYADIH